MALAEDFIGWDDSEELMLPDSKRYEEKDRFMRDVHEASKDLSEIVQSGRKVPRGHYDKKTGGANKGVHKVAGSSQIAILRISFFYLVVAATNKTLVLFLSGMLSLITFFRFLQEGEVYSVFLWTAMACFLIGAAEWRANGCRR